MPSLQKDFIWLLIFFSRCFHSNGSCLAKNLCQAPFQALGAHKAVSKICWMKLFLGETTKDDLEKTVLTLDVHRLWMHLNRSSRKSELIWCWYHGFVADGMADILSQATWTIFNAFPVKLSRQLSDVLTQLVKLLGITLLKTNMAPGKWTL